MNPHAIVAYQESSTIRSSLELSPASFERRTLTSIFPYTPFGNKGLALIELPQQLILHAPSGSRLLGGEGSYGLAILSPLRLFPFREFTFKLTLSGVSADKRSRTSIPLRKQQTQGDFAFLRRAVYSISDSHFNSSPTFFQNKGENPQISRIPNSGRTSKRVPSTLKVSRSCQCFYN